ncbi:MAG: preprotein translocase subunit SecG [Deltaproteobacteria bacterium]|nr:preprotein translocase subunit SecG [Deltaproteobacteria bacterium]
MGALLVTIHVLVSLFLIFVILLQPGKGDGMAALGGSSSGTAFGGSGSVTLLSKITQACAIIFMCTSLALAWRSSNAGSVLAHTKLAEAPAAAPAPAAPAAPATGAAAPAAPATGTAAPAAPATGSAAPAAPAKAPEAPKK